MVTFLNLKLHSFGPGNFLPLVKIVKFQKGLIEENESYKMVYCTKPTYSGKVVYGRNRMNLCTNPILIA
jgi:hypothetical protein